MSWIKEWQEVMPGLAALSLAPKVIITVVVVGLAALFLVLLWTPPPETAVKELLSLCYRRALFTRMHAQLNIQAMFASIDECREAVQVRISKIHNSKLQKTAVNLLSTLDNIERQKSTLSADVDFQKINLFKLSALHDFRYLAVATDNSYPLPNEGSLAEASYFTDKEAAARLSEENIKNAQKIDPTSGEGVPSRQ